jgi:hypothetical protein
MVAMFNVLLAAHVLLAVTSLLLLLVAFTMFSLGRILR